MRVHNVELAILKQDIVLLQILARGQLLSVAIDLVVLVLHVVVVL